MSKNPDFRDKEQRDAFFCEVSQLVGEKLPEEMRNFNDATTPGNNWMRLRYRGRLPNVLYELQFATELSKQHKHYFGSGDKVVLALYYDNLKLRDAWLQAMKPYKPLIEDQLCEEVVLGLWGKSYVILGKRLDSQKLGVEPEWYANEIAMFIHATFRAVGMVNKETKGNP